MGTGLTTAVRPLVGTEAVTALMTAALVAVTTAGPVATTDRVVARVGRRTASSVVAPG